MITINKVKTTSTITVYMLDGVEIARVQQRTNHGPYKTPYSAIIGRNFVDFKCYKDAAAYIEDRFNFASIVVA